MKARSFVTAAVPAVLLAAGSARAEDLAGKISIGVQVGTQSDLSGQLLKGGKGTLLGKQATVDAKRYRDIYKPAVRYQAFLGYGLSARLELVARGSYYENDAVGVAVGSYNGKGLFAFFGQVEDPNSASDTLIQHPYKEYGAELALRFYFAPQSRLKSFIAPVAGARRVDQMLLSLSAPEAGSRLMNVPFSKSGTILVAGIDLGFAFDVTDHFFVGVDTGVRYQTAPKPSNASQLSGLGGVDHSDARWTAPVVAMVGARF
jgi:hypothetical protein